MDLSLSLHRAGRIAESADRLHEALSVVPPGPAGDAIRVQINSRLGSARSFASADPELERTTRRALEEELSRPTPDKRKIAQHQIALGTALLLRREYDAAAEYLQAAYDEVSAADWEQGPGSFAHLLNGLSIARTGQRRYGESIALLTRALEVERQHNPGSHRSIAIILYNLALAEQLERPQSALEHARESYAVLGRVIDADHPEMLGVLSAIARYAAALGDCEQADEAGCAVVVARANLDVRDPAAARAMMALATSAEKCGTKAQAEEWWRGAVVALNECPSYRQERSRALHRLGLLRLDAGSMSEAESLLASAYDDAVGSPEGVPSELLESLARLARAQER
jgi:tetratricopeptide (TPR) repeat protein